MRKTCTAGEVGPRAAPDLAACTASTCVSGSPRAHENAPTRPSNMAIVQAGHVDVCAGQHIAGAGCDLWHRCPTGCRQLSLTNINVFMKHTVVHFGSVAGPTVRPKSTRYTALPHRQRLLLVVRDQWPRQARLHLQVLGAGNGSSSSRSMVRRPAPRRCATDRPRGGAAEVTELNHMRGLGLPPSPVCHAGGPAHTADVWRGRRAEQRRSLEHHANLRRAGGHDAHHDPAPGNDEPGRSGQVSLAHSQRAEHAVPHRPMSRSRRPLPYVVTIHEQPSAARLEGARWLAWGRFEREPTRPLKQGCVPEGAARPQPGRSVDLTVLARPAKLRTKLVQSSRRRRTVGTTAPLQCGACQLTSQIVRWSTLH